MKSPSTARKILLLSLIFGLLGIVTSVWAANEGEVLSLYAEGYEDPGDYTVYVTVRAIDNINNSRFWFEIRDSTNTAVETHGFNGIPSLDSGDTYPYQWTANNSSYPQVGAYTIYFCWSPGGGTPGPNNNCNITGDPVFSTSFDSISTLDTGFMVLSVSLIGFWLWRFRRQLFSV